MEKCQGWMKVYKEVNRTKPCVKFGTEWRKRKRAIRTKEGCKEKIGRKKKIGRYTAEGLKVDTRWKETNKGIA